MISAEFGTTARMSFSPWITILKEAKSHSEVANAPRHVSDFEDLKKKVTMLCGESLSDLAK